MIDRTGKYICIYENYDDISSFTDSFTYGEVYEVINYDLLDNLLIIDNFKKERWCSPKRFKHFNEDLDIKLKQLGI